MNQYFNLRLLGAALVGLAGYLRAASSPDPKARRQRYMLLFSPVVPELIVGLPTRLNSKEGITSGGRLSCLPFYLSPFALVAYTLFLRPRIRPGRQLENVLMWRRIAAVLLGVGAYVRATAFPLARSRGDWLMVASPIASEVVEEVVERHNPTVARRLAVATTTVLGVMMIALSRRGL